MNTRALGIVFLLACSKPTPTSQMEVSITPTTSASASASPPDDAKLSRRCLPVVAKACGCVYSCGVGKQVGDHWMVTHPFWKPNDLRAKIEPWCVGGQCTDAFSAEIVCDAICTPKPADATCHFDAANACVSAAP